MMRGKIVLVPFPFDDLTTQKARPAVCLTDALGSHRHVVLAFITSREPDDPLATDVALEPGHPDFEQTGLRVRSTLRVHRLLTLSSNIIKRELGSLSPSLHLLVSQAVRKLFELKNVQPPQSDPNPGSES